MKTNKLATWILVLFIFLSTATAIGVSPIRKIVDYEPNKQEELSILIKNDGSSDIRGIVYARGALAEQIGLIDSLVTISTQEGQKEARYSLTHPASLDPGVHKTDIVVMEYPADFGTNANTVVSATASVVSELWVRVPYPGKYAESTLYIDSSSANVQFAIDLMNFGKEDIDNAYAILKVVGATYEELALLTTNDISIKTGEQGKLVAQWPANVNPGRYHVIAEIFYDDKKIVTEKNFDVGDLVIDITGIDVSDFALGQVAKFDIHLESKWNEPIGNVFAEITVLDSDLTEYDTIKTASIDLAALGDGTLNAFWDTANVNVGVYHLRILLHYAEKVTEKLIKTEVNIDSIRTEFGPTAQVVASPGSTRDTLLVAIVLILILINAGWFVYFIRTRK